LRGCLPRGAGIRDFFLLIGYYPTRREREFHANPLTLPLNPIGGFVG